MIESQDRKNDFPVIAMHDNFFEVSHAKNVRKDPPKRFYYDQIQEIEYGSEVNKWWFKISTFASIYWAFRSQRIPYKLIIKDLQGEEWHYNAPHDFDPDFAKQVLELIEKCNLEKC